MEQAGKRLLAKIVDDAAEKDPERRFALIPQGPELTDGFRTLSMKDMSRAVNFFCCWIESTLGPAKSRETLAYMGSNDVRYCFFLLACQKLGYQVGRFVGWSRDRILIGLIGFLPVYEKFGRSLYPSPVRYGMHQVLLQRGAQRPCFRNPKSFFSPGGLRGSHPEGDTQC